MCPVCGVGSTRGYSGDGKGPQGLSVGLTRGMAAGWGWASSSSSSSISSSQALGPGGSRRAAGTGRGGRRLWGAAAGAVVSGAVGVREGLRGSVWCGDVSSGILNACLGAPLFRPLFHVWVSLFAACLAAAAVPAFLCVPGSGASKPGARLGIVRAFCQIKTKQRSW